MFLTDKFWVFAHFVLSSPQKEYSPKNIKINTHLHIMKKIFGYGVVCTTLLVAASCGEKKSNEVAVPTADPVAYTDTVRHTNGKGVYNFMEVRGYNAQGEVTVIDGYTVKDGKGEIFSEQTIYQNGLPVYVKSVDENGNLTGEEISTCTDGRITETLVKEFNIEKQKMQDKSKVVYSYDANGNVISILESVCENLHWNNAYEWTYAYDEQDRVNDRKDYTYTDGRKQSRWELYAYDEQGRLSVYDYYFFDIRKGRQKHDSKTTYFYNAAGLLEKAVVERHKNTLKREPVKSREYIYDYNDKGQLTYFARQKYTVSTKSLNNEFSINNLFDEQGRLVQRNSISLVRPKTESSYIAYSYSDGAVNPTSVAESGKTSFFIPVTDGKPVINLTEANKSLTEMEDE